MGNASSNFRQTLAEEFSRVGGSPPPPFLPLERVLELRLPYLDIRNPSMLFVLNRAKDGRFTLDDLYAFLDVCCRQCAGNNVPTSELQPRVQGYCTSILLRSVMNSRNEFASFLTNLLLGGEVLKFPLYPGFDFVHRDRLEILYTLFDLKDIGRDFEDWFSLLQEAAEEKGILQLQDASLDEYVPLNVLKSFSQQVAEGAYRSVRDVLTLSDLNA